MALKRREDRSFGIVPLRRNQGVWDVFLVQHRHGHWSLPKGHPENTETPLDTAKRELYEETGLSVVQLLEEMPLVEHYQFRRGDQLIQKTVEYFIAEVGGKEQIAFRELQQGVWAPLQSTAQELASFPQMKLMLKQVDQILSSHG